MKSLFKTEPALLLGLVNAVIVLVMAFGVQLTLEQTGAILALVNIALAIITRSQVTPISRIAKGDQ